MSEAALPKHVWSSDKETVGIILAICKAEGVKNFLEIGTCIGSTSFAVANEKINVVTCDVDDQVHEKVKKLKNVRFVLGDREELFASLPDGFKADAIFIDGDHSYQAVKDDFKKAEQHKIPLIFLHDCYGIKDVEKFCKEQFTNPHYQVLTIKTTHIDGYPNGIAIFKLK